jgi:DNA-binding CsgD family transcriptional regulator
LQDQIVVKGAATLDRATDLLERSEQLSALDRALAAVRGGAGCVVLLSGEAGVGKTTLLRRFCRDADARVLWGACDGLFTPRPLGPLLDVAQATGGEFARLVEVGALPHDVAMALLRELALRTPTVVVLEDVHWADGATLDVLRLLGRRVPGVPALVIASYRDTELQRFHPLRQVLGQLSSDGSCVRVRLGPLSEEAVVLLAGPHGVDSAGLYRVTGGNPFFVTEALAAGEGTMPETVRDAVLAHAARLSARARVLLEAVAVTPPQADLLLLEALAPDALAALDESLASGLLVKTDEGVAFRHELARLAIEEAIAPDRALELHRAALAALAAAEASDARIAHHADRAGDAEAVLTYAPAAGKRAAALGAHREAAAQFERALRFGDRLGPVERARLLQRRSYACFLTAQEELAVVATDEALACYREVGDRAQEAACLRWRGLALSNLGRIAEAAASLLEAVALLEQLPPGHELAMAYNALAGLAVLSEDTDEVRRWANRANELAERLGDVEAHAGALASLGCLEALQRTADAGEDKLARALTLSREAGFTYQAGIVYASLGMSGCRARSLKQMEEAADAGRAYCDEHGVLPPGRLLTAMRSWIALERCEWEQAADIVSLVLAERCTMSCLQSQIVLGLLRARRGDPDPWTPLAEAREVAELTGQLWWLWQVAAASAEAAWLAGEPARAADILDATYRLALHKRSPWPLAELAWWRRQAGIDDEVPADAGGPFLLQLHGDFAQAAQAWRGAGCPYEAALGLAASDSVESQRRALAELQSLGAEPAATLVARRLRDRGERGLVRGPRPATRTNPAGLTAREVEVLQLVAQGLRNAQIADRLVLSERTVDHHVAAILRKLQVHTRGEASAEAHRLGLAGQAG